MEMISVRRKTEEEDRNGIIAIAVDRGKNCSLAVRWAVEHLLLKNGPPCFLVHVLQSKYPTSSEEMVVGGGRSPTKDEVAQFFLPYQTFCAKKGIKTIELILEDSNITAALTEFIIGNSIGTMILGAYSKSSLTRRIRNILDVPTSILRAAPESCAVYIVSKGKVQTGRKPSVPNTPSSIATSFRLTPLTQTPNYTTAPSTPRILHSLASMTVNQWYSQTSMKWNASPPPKQQPPIQSPQEHDPYLTPDSPDSDSRISFSRSSWKSEVSDRMSCSQGSCIDSMHIPCTQTRSRTTSLATLLDGSQSIDVQNFISTEDGSSGPPSVPSIGFSSSENLDSSTAFPSSRSSNISEVNPRDLEEEMRRLRVELKRSIQMYKTVRMEAAVAKKQMESELQQLHTFEARKLEEERIAEAWNFAETEKQKAAAALEAARMAQKLAEIEFRMRKNAEVKAMQEMEGRQRAAQAQALPVSSNAKYRKYTIEQIEAATDSFENSNKIGEGGYGPVFKGILDHTPVAVKVLRPNMACGQRQFRQEIEVLSTMRHPHMVILIGACPEYGTLVYEYMEKGSLEDCLFRKRNTPPIPWRIRFRIAAEIASGILFLHEAKPEPLVHRDLKPANILLDRNYVSKIADVGLARLVPPSVADNVTQYRLTAAAGTFCYIDPEYQQTGMLGVKSDLYSLGIMLLQLITARPPMGLSYQVEEAIRKETFSEVLDPELTDWPVEEALSFANMALKCCELRKKDRPDLGTVVLPELIRLRDFAFPNEADEPEIIEIPALSCPGTSESAAQLQAQDSCLKMNPKWCWQKKLKVRTMTKAWSHKRSSSAGPRSRGHLPQGQNPSARKSELLGCWSSFSSCNRGSDSPVGPVQRVNSFS